MNQDMINCFIDSNVWLYAFMQQSDIQKMIKAKNLLINQDINIIISSQVINEVCFNLRKKSQFSEIKLKSLIQNFYDNYNVVNIEEQTMILASNIRLSYNVSFWDSLVISSALESKSQIIYTEDMQHNLIINDTLQIINPFN